MRACELDELCVAGVYGAEGGGAHDKARAVDEELFGAGYGFIPDRLEGALAAPSVRQVARELAVDVPSCRKRPRTTPCPAGMSWRSAADPVPAPAMTNVCASPCGSPDFQALAEALVEGAMLKAVELANRLRASICPRVRRRGRPGRPSRKSPCRRFSARAQVRGWT